jgi:hypothetical protein
VRMRLISGQPAMSSGRRRIPGRDVGATGVEEHRAHPLAVGRVAAPVPLAVRAAAHAEALALAPALEILEVGDASPVSRPGAARGSSARAGSGPRSPTATGRSPASSPSLAASFARAVVGFFSGGSRPRRPRRRLASPRCRCRAWSGPSWFARPSCAGSALQREELAEALVVDDDRRPCRRRPSPRSCGASGRPRRADRRSARVVDVGQARIAAHALMVLPRPTSSASRKPRAAAAPRACDRARPPRSDAGAARSRRPRRCAAARGAVRARARPMALERVGLRRRTAASAAGSAKRPPSRDLVGRRPSGRRRRSRPRASRTARRARAAAARWNGRMRRGGWATRPRRRGARRAAEQTRCAWRG